MIITTVVMSFLFLFCGLGWMLYPLLLHALGTRLAHRRLGCAVVVRHCDDDDVDAGVERCVDHFGLHGGHRHVGLALEAHRAP